MAEQAAPQAVQISVNAQYLKDISFESPQAPGIFSTNMPQPEIQVQVDCRATNLAQDVFECALTLKGEAKGQGKTMFLVEAVYAGVFTLRGLPEEHRRPFLLIEAPRLLFPFLRQIVADTTQKGGFPPLMVDPIDFAELYRRQVAADSGQKIAANA